jgi:hypothetical protein
MMAVVAIAVLLGGCCFGGGASAPAPVPPATAPVAPTGCPELQAAILGTWTREGFVEEYRADGTYVVNGRTGTFSWIEPGHAMLDVPDAQFHVPYHLGLADVNQLIAIDPSNIATAYVRSSPPPAVDAACYERRAAWVGTWIGGPMPEAYAADGTYAIGSVRGQWSFPSNGRLHLQSTAGPAGEYWIAHVSPTAALAMPLPPLEPRGVVYTRQP